MFAATMHWFYGNINYAISQFNSLNIEDDKNSAQQIVPKKDPFPFLSLPNDLIVRVITLCKTKELNYVECSSKLLRTTIAATSLWNNLALFSMNEQEKKRHCTHIQESPLLPSQFDGKKFLENLTWKLTDQEEVLL